MEFVSCGTSILGDRARIGRLRRDRGLQRALIELADEYETRATAEAGRERLVEVDHRSNRIQRTSTDSKTGTARTASLIMADRPGPPPISAGGISGTFLIIRVVCGGFSPPSMTAIRSVWQRTSSYVCRLGSPRDWLAARRPR
jgi:hypothetical protein